MTDGTKRLLTEVEDRVRNAQSTTSEPNARLVAHGLCAIAGAIAVLALVLDERLSKATGGQSNPG